MTTTTAPLLPEIKEEDVYDFLDTLLLQIGLTPYFRYPCLIVFWLIFLVITFYSLSRVDAHDRRLQARDQKRKIAAEEKSFQATKEEEIKRKREKDRALTREATKELKKRDGEIIVEEL